MKKIVFVINYFYPDLASTGQLMTELCSKLEDNFEIIVIAAKPDNINDNEIKVKANNLYLGKVKIVHVNLPKVNKSSKLSRLKFIIIYFIKALIEILKIRKIDLIYSISTPPVLGGLLGTLGKFFKRTKHLYNIQDFNPEQAIAANYTKGSIISGIAKKVDNINCRYSDHIVLVGNDMADTLRNRFNENNLPNYSIINNWTDESEILPLKKNDQHVHDFISEHKLDEKFIIMYSGNLGLYYDLENLVKLAKDFRNNQEIVFLFVGEGARKNEMKIYVEAHNLNNVRFLPFQPLEFIKYSLNAADAHLVVNQKGIKGVSVPSKIYGVLAAGKPILGVLEEGSEAERLIRESGAGFVSEPGDYNSIRISIQRMYDLSNVEREKMGLAGRTYLDQHLQKEISINKYRELLTKLTN